jgi:hypothetical protein
MHRLLYVGLALLALVVGTAPAPARADNRKSAKTKAADKSADDQLAAYVGTWSALTNDNTFRQTWFIKKSKNGKKLLVSGTFLNGNGQRVGRFLGTNVKVDQDSGELQFDQDFGAPGCRKPVAGWDTKPHVRATVEEDVLSFNSYPQGSDRPYQNDKITLKKSKKKKAA